LLQLEATAAEDGKNGGGIGGTDDGPKESGLDPIEAEEVGGQGKESGGKRDSEGGEDRSGCGNAANGSEGGIKATVKEDEDEGDGAEADGKGVIIEGQFAEALGTADHTQNDEEEYDGDAEAVDGAAEEDAEGDEDAEDHEEDGGGVGLGEGGEAGGKM
jgi:hypothetical protein